MEFIPRDEVEWREVHMLERPDETFEYTFILPRPLADWDVFACWERARFHHMRDHLTRGEILFDVGTEQGWVNLIYAQFVGPENMVLIEPTPEFWPNIQATWEKNYTTPPRATYAGLLGDTDVIPARGNYAKAHSTSFGCWPEQADGPLIDRNKYQYLHEHDDCVDQIKLDDLAAYIVPDAITIDVEGAELQVLHGAADTLVNHRPKVWASVHHDLIERDYNATANDVHTFMESLGYTKHFIAEDHEAHWYYAP